MAHRMLSPRRLFEPPDALHQTISFAVKPAPPVEETNLMRKNLACTLATARASPVVAVGVSIGLYFPSLVALPPLQKKIPAVGGGTHKHCPEHALPGFCCPA